MRSYKNLRDLFLQNVFYSKLNCLLDQHLKTLIQSFVNEHTGEILSYAVSLANDHKYPYDKTQQLINLIAGVENAQELNDLYCDAEVCLAIGPDDKLDKEVIEDLNAHFIENLDVIKKLLEERALTLEVTSTPSPMEKAKDCSPVARPGLVLVAKWTKEQRLDQEADEQVSTNQEGSTTDFGFTTSPSDTDVDDKGLSYQNSKSSSEESLSSLPNSASNSSSDVEDHNCHTPPPGEDTPFKRQCLGVERRGLEPVKNGAAEERKNLFGETESNPGFSFCK